jgi:hypothetical protein
MSDTFTTVAGIYTLTWEQEALVIRIDRLSEDSRHNVSGEILIRSGGRHVHQARMNLTSTRSRDDVVKQCDKRAADVDWTSFIEEAAVSVLEQFRAGEPMIDMATYVPSTGNKYKMYPLLLEGQANLLYGLGGSGKSYLATLIAAKVSKGYQDEYGEIHPPERVLYLDYETGADEIYSRLSSIQMGLGLEPTPQILYHSSSQSLIVEIEQIQRTVAEEDVRLVIVDSVAYACGGEAETSLPATNYSNALRSLHTTTLSIGHVSKDVRASTPYGSVFWFNGARSIWEVVRSQDTGTNMLNIGLIHRKVNNGSLAMPLGYQVSFENDCVYFNEQEISMVPEAEEKLPLRERIEHLLASEGELPVADIAQMLERAEGTIRKTLHRSSQFKVSKNGAQSAHWALASQADLTEPVSDGMEVAQFADV